MIDADINPKFIDEIKKARRLVSVRKEVQAEFDREWEVAQTQNNVNPMAKSSCYYPAHVQEISSRLMKIDRDLRQLQQTILIHLQVVKD